MLSFDSWLAQKAQKNANENLHRQLVSVKVWKAFVVAYLHEGVDALKRKHHVITRPNMKLGDYVTPLISPSVQWVAFLSLSNMTCVRITAIHLYFFGPDLTPSQICITNSKLFI